MVKFSAPQHTQGPLAGYAVTGRWVSVKRDPEWRGEVGREDYEYAHHYEPAIYGMDPIRALARAWEYWRETLRGYWREPDHVEVDAVPTSSLSRPADSPADPFQDITGEQGGHDGYLANRRKGA